MKEELDFLDELLREQVDEAQIPFKEEYWDKMSARLDEEDKGNKRGFPFWRGLSILLLLLATGIGAYVVPKFLTKKSEAKNEQSVLQFEAGQPVVSQTTPSITNNNDLKNNSNELKNNRLEQSVSSDYSSEASSSSPEQALQPTPSTPVTSSNATVINQHQPSKPATQHPHASTASSTPHASIPLTSNSSNKPANLSDTNPQSTSSSVSVAGTKPSPIHKKNRHTNLVSLPRSSKQTGKKDLEATKQNHVSGTPAAQNPVVVNPAKPVLTSNPTNPNDPTIVVNGQPYQVKSRTVEKTRVALSPEQSNPRYLAHLQHYQPIIDCTITSVLAPTNLENTSTTSPSSSPENTKSKAKGVFDFEKRLLLFATLGMNLNKGLKGNADNQQSWAVSPYIGFGAEKPIRSDLSISATLGFTYFNGLNMVKRDNMYTYSFGVDSTEQRLYTRKLYQLYLPLNTQYKLLERHFIFGGIGMTYSFQTSGKLEQTTYSPQAYNLNPSSVNKSQTNTSLISEYNKGFQTFDFFLQAGYSYRFMERWSAQIMLQQGFMDISKNSYYNNTIRNNLTRVSLGLKFNIK